MPESEVLDLPLVDLPWRDAYGNPKRSAGNAIARHLTTALRKYYPNQPTVRDALEYFTNAANSGTPIAIKSYGLGLHKITQQIFRESGIELPEVRLATSTEKQELIREFFEKAFR